MLRLMVARMLRLLAWILRRLARVRWPRLALGLVLVLVLLLAWIAVRSHSRRIGRLRVLPVTGRWRNTLVLLWPLLRHALVTSGRGNSIVCRRLSMPVVSQWLLVLRIVWGDRLSISWLGIARLAKRLTVSWLAMSWLSWLAISLRWRLREWLRIVLGISWNRLPMSLRCWLRLRLRLVPKLQRLRILLLLRRSLRYYFSIWTSVSCRGHRGSSSRSHGPRRLRLLKVLLLRLLLLLWPRPLHV